MGQAVSGEATDAEVDIIVDADGDGDVDGWWALSVP